MSEDARPELAGLDIADPPERWRALGFTVTGDGRVDVDGIALTLGGSGTGITGWTLRHVAEGDVGGLPTAIAGDGLPTTVAGAPGSARPDDHPNGAIGVDHVVIVAPRFDDLSQELEARGMALRRVRQAGDRRQGFRRLGPAILEIVEAPEAPRTAFWGVTLVMRDLRALGPQLAPHVGEIRDAVQPGRRIATLDRDAGLSTPVAFMDPG